MTTGYVLPAGAAQASAPTPTLVQAQPAAVASAERIDVAGIKLGMSPDEVRAALKPKKLMNYFESADVLSRSDARYVNTIAAWTASAAPGGGTDRQGESYEIMFTPVPGKERAMAVVHSRGLLIGQPSARSHLRRSIGEKVRWLQSG